MFWYIENIFVLSTSLNTYTKPFSSGVVFKEIISKPLPKKLNPSCNYDYRPE